MNKTLKLTFAALALAAAFNAQAETRAVIETNMGNISLSLDETKAPKTVANFVSYARKGFYDNTVFHRVIDGFMIQGGGFTPDMVHCRQYISQLQKQNPARLRLCRLRQSNLGNGCRTPNQQNAD